MFKVGVKMVQVGLAGLGNFGRLHGRILSSLSNVEIVAVCDPKLTNQDISSLGFSKAQFVKSYEELIAIRNLDCLFIITPEDLHFTQAMAASQLGIPVFMEKPLGTTAEEANEIVTAFKKSNSFLQIGFVLRFEDQHTWLKQQISRGTFGNLVSIRGKRNCSAAWFDTYGDRAHTAFETIIHDIDLMIWFTGSRCKSVYATQRNISGKKYPDAFFAILHFENGTVGMLETSWFVPKNGPQNVLTENWSGTIDAELEIVGTQQTAQLRLLHSNLSTWSSERCIHNDSSLWPESHGKIGGALRAEVEHFINCVERKEPSSIASVEDAFHGLCVAEALVRSAESNKVEVV